MIKSIEVSGKTEDDAIETALAQLGLTRDDVSVEIVERAKSGFLGLKNTPAVVRVSYEQEGEDPVSMPSSKEEKLVPAKEENTASADQVREFLAGLFPHMGIEAEMEITTDGNTVSVVLTSSEPGVLIGRRGETLDAMQHLANYSINRGKTNRVRINFDAENYRARRSQTLEQLATKIAAKVVKYRKNMTLDPMNAYERHIIHTALQEYDNITTYSVGNEPNRRIVVAYGRKSDNNGRQGGPNYREWS